MSRPTTERLACVAMMLATYNLLNGASFSKLTRARGSGGVMKPDGSPGFNIWQLCHDVARNEPVLAQWLREAGMWPRNFVDEAMEDETQENAMDEDSVEEDEGDAAEVGSAPEENEAADDE